MEGVLGGLEGGHGGADGAGGNGGLAAVADGDEEGGVLVQDGRAEPRSVNPEQDDEPRDLGGGAHKDLRGR